MTKFALFVVVSLFMVNCGGGGTSSKAKDSNKKTATTIKDELLKNSTWYVLEKNSSKTFKFTTSLWSVVSYKDKEFKTKNKSYTYTLSKFNDDEFKAKRGDKSYDCSVSNFSYDENSCMEIECVSINGNSDIDNLDYYIFKSKSKAISNSGECY